MHGRQGSGEFGITHLGRAGSPETGVAARSATLLQRRYLLWWRLAVRLVEAASLMALGRDPHGLGLAAAAACAIYDVCLAAWLRRSGRAAIWPRLALDAADMTAWSLAMGEVADVVVLTASPLAVEAGMRMRWRGLVVPLVLGATGTAVQLAVGRPPAAAPFLWPAVAVAAPALAIRYLEHVMDRRLRAAGAEIEAAASRAQLAGQNSVAACADSVVDLLTRTTPLLSAGDAALRPSRVAAWKQALATASTGQASYLGVALSRWQRLRNSMSPDLTADVELRCLDAAGTLLLSPAQADALGRVLDALPLRGVEPVAVPSPAPAGSEQTLVVGGRRVLLPADARPSVPALDPGPLALLLGAASCLSQSLPGGDAVPLPVTLPLAAAGCGLAWWAHRHVERRGRTGHGAVLAAALLFAAADAVLATQTMRNPVVDHLVRFPFLLFLVWFGPLLVVYWRDLSDRPRGAALGGAAVIVATGFALLPAPPPAGHLLVALVWPASAILACLGLRDMLERDDADLAARVERRHQEAVERAYRQGRRLVLQLVAEAATDAWNAFFEVRDGLPADAGAEFERRLTEVDGRLAELGGQPEPRRRERRRRSG